MAGSERTQAEIELAEVSKIYPAGDGEVAALRGVSLRIAAGDFVAIMGPSGSGKSTFMNMVGLLDRPTSGQVFLGGREVGSLAAAARAQLRGRQVGFVFQGFNLLPRTSAVDNVALPLAYQDVPGAEARRRAQAALAEVGLAERLEHTPQQLSGGQQQRVAIARALVARPRLLLADEPTGNLDSRTSLEVMALLQELGAAGLTIVLVTHETDVAAFASRQVSFRDGRVADDSGPRPARNARAQLQP